MLPVNAAAVRIAVSSSTFRRRLQRGTLTQLEWVERCSSELGVDGILADIDDFPRRDPDYVAQLRKVAIDLGIVPLGIDADGLFEPAASVQWREEVFGIANGFGAELVRTRLPAPGPVPPATFVEVTGIAKAASRAAKAANVTLLARVAPGTLGDDLAGVKHLVKDVDSAWLRPAPSALADTGAKDRFPAVSATPDDDPPRVAERASRSWLVLEIPALDDPWKPTADALIALRRAEAELILGRRDRSGHLDPG